MSRTLHVSPDAVLIERLREGDEGAVDELARQYRSRINQLALTLLKNPEDAEEITQDVLFKAVDKVSEFRGDSALSSWLYRITFNAALSRLRQLRSRQSEVPEAAIDAAPTGEAADIADWSEMADEAVLRNQMRTRLARAIRRLPAIYRAPVILRDFRGLSTEEASHALRLNGQTLKSRLHRGRMMLRRDLSDFAEGLALHRA